MLSLQLYVVTFLIIRCPKRPKKILNAINLTIIKKYKTPFISVLTVVPAALILSQKIVEQRLESPT